jgi:hypothetical protein
MESGKQKARTLKWLRRRRSDASGRKPRWQAFSDFVVPLTGVASSQVGRLAQIGRSSSRQTHALRLNVGALTNRSFGRFASLRAKQLSRYTQW